MSPKRLVTGALLLFVVVSVGFLLSQEHTSGGPSPAAEHSGAAALDQVVAYYFHGKARCVTCQRLEAYAEEALRTGYPSLLNEGQLAWRVVDTSVVENKHFVTDYQLQHQSVVLVEMRNGEPQRWVKLDQIWQKVGNKDEYIAYVQNEVQRFLAAERDD
jgi:hypothetical protein